MLTIEEATNERDKFLIEHPNMAKYQKEIDLILEKTPNEKRLEVISVVMACKFVELNQLMSQLRRMIITHAKQ